MSIDCYRLDKNKDVTGKKLEMVRICLQLVYAKSPQSELAHVLLKLFFTVYLTF